MKSLFLNLDFGRFPFTISLDLRSNIRAAFECIRSNSDRYLLLVDSI
jgi:hypothetical protein